jgi:hypothetical protein
MQTLEKVETWRGEQLFAKFAKSDKMEGYDTIVPFTDIECIIMSFTGDLIQCQLSGGAVGFGRLALYGHTNLVASLMASSSGSKVSIMPRYTSFLPIAYSHTTYDPQRCFSSYCL